jgi:hypothetical protein
LLRLITFLLLVTACKSNEASNIEAMEQTVRWPKSMFDDGMPDRIYLAVRDFDPVPGKLGMQASIELSQSDPGRFHASTDVFTTQEVQRQLNRYKTYSKSALFPDGNIHVLACFNEPADPNACMPIPTSVDRFVAGDSFSLLTLQSQLDCKLKPSDSTNTGLRLNRRFRFSDFFVTSSFKKMQDLRGDLRTGCIDLYTESTAIQTLKAYEGIAQAFDATRGDYIKAGISGLGCLIGVGGGVEANSAKMAELLKDPNSIGFLASYGRFLASHTGIAAGVGGIATVMKGFGRIDDVIFKYGSKFFFNVNSAGSPILQEVSKVAGIALSKQLSSALTSVKGGLAGATLLGLKLSPRASRLIDGLDGRPDLGDTGVYTLAQAQQVLGDFEAANPAQASKVDQIMATESFKQAEDALEKFGISSGDMAYMALAVGSIFVPWASCGLLAMDVSEIMDKETQAGNIRGFKDSVESAASSAKGKLDRLAMPDFANLVKVYEGSLGVLSEGTIAAGILEHDTPVRTGERDSDFELLAEHRRAMNFYTAQAFNEAPAPANFRHTGELSAFEDFLRAEGQAKQALDVTIQAAFQSIMAQKELIKQVKELVIVVSDPKNGLDKTATVENLNAQMSPLYQAVAVPETK